MSHKSLMAPVLSILVEEKVYDSLVVQKIETVELGGLGKKSFSSDTRFRISNTQKGEL